MCIIQEASLLHFKYSLSKFTISNIFNFFSDMFFHVLSKVEGGFVYFLQSPVHLFFLKQGPLMAYSAHIRLHGLTIVYWVFVCPHLPCGMKIGGYQQIQSVCLCACVYIHVLDSENWTHVFRVVRQELYFQILFPFYKKLKK